MRATILCVVGCAQCLSAQTDPVPKPAVDYVVRAFDRYPLVALSEWHRARETMDFVGTVIRHAGFAGKVTDIVVEFGNARYQRITDRYIAGEDVPHDELQRVWEDTTQVSGVWSSPIYEAFLGDIRAFNQTVPAGKRIRVLLGDPPIDWNTVTSPADEDMNDWRDAYFAWVVEHEVMSKGRKALLFVGGGHITRKVILPNSLIHLLDKRFPGKTLVISTIQIPTISAHLAALTRSWPLPAAAEVRNTSLGFADVREVGFGLSTGHVQDNIDVVLVLTRQEFSNVPDRIDPNSTYGVELRRRQELQEVTLPFRGGKIRFENNSSSTTKESGRALDTVLAAMNRDRQLRVLVKAYADSTEGRPDELSQRRASVIVQWLVSRGIDRRRLAPLGCGSSRPAWYSDTDEHRAANRRAELVRQNVHAGCQPPSSFDWQ